MYRDCVLLCSYCAGAGKSCSIGLRNIDSAEFLKTHKSPMQSLRERAIAEYHELLAADQTLTPRTFEELRNAMRKNRLLYGERPIGVALRPHLLGQKQFRALTFSAERVTSALEEVAAAVVQDPDLMDDLGLTEAERRMALVDPGFSTAGVTTRLDAFVRGDETKFVESNAENPSSLPDQEELNRLLFELPVMASFAKRYRLRQFSPVKRLLEALLSTYREWGGAGVPNIAILDWKDCLPRVNSFFCEIVSAQTAFPRSSVRRATSSISRGSFDAARFASISFTNG